MTARERLARVRTELGCALLARALMAGAASGVAVYAVARAASTLPIVPALALGVALIVLVLVALPLRRVRSIGIVALWVEEQAPDLRYAVVTLADGVSTPALEAQANAQPWWTMARRATLRLLTWPVAALAVAVVMLLALPARGVARGIFATSRRHTPVDAPRRPVLEHVRVTIVPPAYSGRPTVTTDDPTSVEALVASVVTVAGEGDGSLVVATADSVRRPVTTRDGRWTVSAGMPGRPALLRLHATDGLSRDRLVVFAPVVDAAPAVTLLLPARDTVLRVATGALSMRAQLRDDIGLRDARFELVISSGQEENFTFRTSVVSPTQLRGVTERTLEGRISLDSLALKPGDVLQLRAVARDANTATGPGIGSSDTRSIRVARAGEYDSVSVDPAPPGDPEGQVLSQRMLITMTEAIERRRRSLSHATLLAESGRIAADQAKLRKRVGDIVFQRMGGEPLGEETGGETGGAGAKLTPDELLKRAEAATQGSAGSVMDVEGDETPILAVNKPLLEAFNAMWDAGRSLEQGETNRALPPMRRALAAIERARQAERIYLRGRPSAVVVDVVKARLAGKDKGASSTREPRAPSDPVTLRRAAAFARATALLARDPQAAADSLLVLRVDALESAPALAAALDSASRAVRRGDAAAVSLAWRAVRRALGPAPERGDASSPWSGAP